LSQPIDVEQLSTARMQAEAEARRKASEVGVREVTLHKIYEELSASVDQVVCTALMDEEIATEKDVCYADPEILSIYNQLVKRSVRVAFLSDTYMPRDVIASMLTLSGYAGSLEVFVSSEFGLTKCDGRLFPVLLKSLALKADHTCHIGDNAISDVVNARRAGIRAFWFRPSLFPRRVADREAFNERSVSTSLLKGLTRASVKCDKSDEGLYRAIGQCVAGPLYLGFAQWVLENVKSSGAEAIYFCARDGLIVKQVYDRLSESDPSAPSSAYLWVSRRSLVFPAIQILGEAELDFLTSNQRAIPVRDFLARIGLRGEDCARALTDFDLTLDTLVHNSSETRSKLRGMLKSLQKEIIGTARDERELLSSYLDQEGCNAMDLFAVCDIGWAASLQKALARILVENNPRTEITGYYLGTVKQVRDDPGRWGSARGWLVDEGAPSERNEVLATGRAVLELLFTAQHGSVVGYSTTCDGVEPITNVLETTYAYESAAAKIQASALRFVDSYIRAYGGVAPIPLDLADVFPAVKHLIDRPSVREARLIGDLVHVDGFGATRGGQALAGVPSLLECVLHPIDLRQRFIQAPWRTGFLVRITSLSWAVCWATEFKRRIGAVKRSRVGLGTGPQNNRTVNESR
jgi:predicted HAD superfamily hydrolase